MPLILISLCLSSLTQWILLVLWEDSITWTIFNQLELCGLTHFWVANWYFVLLSSEWSVTFSPFPINAPVLLLLFHNPLKLIELYYTLWLCFFFQTDELNKKDASIWNASMSLKPIWLVHETSKVFIWERIFISKGSQHMLMSSSLFKAKCHYHFPTFSVQRSCTSAQTNDQNIRSRHCQTVRLKWKRDDGENKKNKCRSQW